MKRVELMMLIYFIYSHEYLKMILFETGSCVIRMCADFIGFDTFQRGLTRYLNDKYKNKSIVTK